MVIFFERAVMFEAKEVKLDGKRAIQITATIDDTGKAPTAKGNVSCGGTGGNVATSIKGPSGKPITCGMFMYSAE
jgi:hypothetical protein